jgi:Fn3 associated/Bacterial Ig-like domain (group 2)
MGLPALATTYTVPAGSGVAAIQQIINTASAGPGNTVMFSAGAYNLSGTVYLPCTNGVVYSGPLVGQQKISYNSKGVMSIGNLPTAIFTVPPDNYVFGVESNGTTNTTPTAGCTIQYMGFNGTQGGIYVGVPSSGITIQNNAFYNNNPDWALGWPDAYPGINLDGYNGGNTPGDGQSYVSVLWNTFFNNCASIIANGWPDAGGECNAVHIQGYSNHLTINNNIINQIEEGFKFYEQSYQYAIEFNTDVENNNIQGNSRIAIEDQQPNNANVVFSHNAFYQPTNPSYNTFELSLPLNQCGSNAGGCNGDGSGQATITNDNVFLGNVPITIDCNGTTCSRGVLNGTGSGAHYGIGLEQWGVGATAQYNLFQGGNEPDTCAGGFGCSGWGVSIGEPFSNVNDTNNYFSGYDIVSGGGGIGFEDDATPSNPGMIISPNTTVATSATIPTTAPAILTSQSSGAPTVTLSDSDTNHRLSIFYTTDGTTPAIFGPGGSAGTTQVYSAPFTVAPGSTVKAIAHWGQGANQGIVFPSFGYVPSAVTSLTVGATTAATTAAPPATSTPTGPALLGAWLDNKTSANSLAVGGTMQFTAYGYYADGTSGVLPDAYGNKVTMWGTSNHSKGKMSMGGRLTAMAAGSVDVRAQIGTLQASPWTMTIGSPATPPPSTTASAGQSAASTQTAPATAGSSSAASTSTSASGNGSSAGTGTSGASSTPPPVVPVTVAPVSSVAAGPAPAGPGPVQPDAFLGPFWQLVSPVGGSASISNSHLYLGVPGGTNHDALLPSNQAVRVVQPIGNGNFDVAIKIDSQMYASDANTSQGLMVISDSLDYLTFALVTNGTSIGLSANVVSRGANTSVLNDQAFSQYQNPMYLRLSKTGSAYVAFYSVDGVSWTQAASFSSSAPTTAIGPFASNYNYYPAAAVPVVMSTNWFDVR